MTLLSPFITRYNPYFYAQGAYHAAYNQQGGDRGFAQAMPRGYPTDYSTQVNRFVFCSLPYVYGRHLPTTLTLLFSCLINCMYTVSPPFFFEIYSGEYDGLWDGVWTGSTSPRAIQ